MQSIESFLENITQWNSAAPMPHSSLQADCRNSEQLPIEVRKAADIGLLVFPIPVNATFSMIKEAFDAATCDVERLAKWAASHASPCNWGIVTGKRSGVYVLEVDGAMGKASIQALCKDEFEAEETLMAVTGEKVYAFFRWSETIDACKRQLAPGLVLHSDDYILIPPSRLRSGATVAFANPEVPVATSPEWIVQLAIVQRETRKAGKILPMPIKIASKALLADSVDRSSGAKLFTIPGRVFVPPTPGALHRVYMSFSFNGCWSCQFFDVDLQLALPGVLHFQNSHKLTDLIQRGGGAKGEESLRSLDRALRCGMGGTALHLTEEQYAKLKTRCATAAR